MFALLIWYIIPIFRSYKCAKLLFKNSYGMVIFCSVSDGGWLRFSSAT